MCVCSRSSVVMGAPAVPSLVKLQLQKSQYLQLGPSRGQYYGGSLPNVNQIGSGTVDLPFQRRVLGAQGRASDDSTIPLTHTHADSCPYGTVYLSPPADTSWRRTNSDSALHQSTMTPAQPEPFTGGSQDAHQKKGQGSALLVPPRSCKDSFSASPSSPTPPHPSLTINSPWNGGDHIRDGQEPFQASMGHQEGKSLRTGSRPKSCEVPGINIFPSADQENTTALIPATHNTGGSLPDLTNIHFPSPLPTPLDPEEPTFPALSSSSSTGNLAANLTHLGIGGAGQGMSTPGSSPQHRPTGVSPLSLSTEARRQQAQQVSPTLSPLSPITQHSSTLGGVFGDSFYEQQMAARQANALSHQLEQFNMIENAISSSSLYSPGSTLNYSQAAMMGLTGSHGSLPDTQQLSFPSHSSIPNIILTGERPREMESQPCRVRRDGAQVSLPTEARTRQP
ncbi:hypothetical protein E2I00_018676 [Balaenoptera physalus]|uniref:Transducer of regulated CREB activity middle domain-containing protein n=1 Tax=Balaenoptera physalus TaxID=9770 RepID=A0A6A1QK82_BALPH|nr:hypothetical protein E2I00_018676 [Balaenoptera physalus]